MLMNNCGDQVDEIIKLCRLYNVPEEKLWNPLLSKARHENSTIPQLLNNVESYRKPHRFIKAYDDNTTLEDHREPLM